MPTLFFVRHLVRELGESCTYEEVVRLGAFYGMKELSRDCFRKARKRQFPHVNYKRHFMSSASAEGHYRKIVATRRRKLAERREHMGLGRVYNLREGATA